METKTLLSWLIPEYHAHERGVFWYIGLGVVGVSLLIYALKTGNILFAFIIIIFTIIVLIHSWAEPKMLDFVIFEDGIRIGGRKHFWRDIKSFWIVYEPPVVKNIYFEFGSGFHPRLSIPLDEQDPVKIREMLLAYLLEDTEKNEEPISEWFGRVFKI